MKSARPYTIFLIVFTCFLTAAAGFALVALVKIANSETGAWQNTAAPIGVIAAIAVGILTAWKDWRKDKEEKAKEGGIDIRPHFRMRTLRIEDTKTGSFTEHTTDWLCCFIANNTKSTIYVKSVMPLMNARGTGMEMVTLPDFETDPVFPEYPKKPIALESNNGFIIEWQHLKMTKVVQYGIYAVKLQLSNGKTLVATCPALEETHGVWKTFKHDANGRLAHDDPKTYEEDSRQFHMEQQARITTNDTQRSD